MYRVFWILLLAAVFPALAEELVLVAGGTFRMGDVFGDGRENESPVHEVKLASFYMAPHEVTVGAFREFVEATGYQTTAEREGGAQIFTDQGMVQDSSACWHRVNFWQGENHPVVGVSWYDAVAYCNWLSVRDGYEPCYSGSGTATQWDQTADGYRLPTAAEWEYAARCRGRDYKYTWGNGDPYIGGKKAANIRDEAALRGWGAKHVKTYWKGYDDGFLFTSPVGAFAPNELSLYGLCGNVYEWCWDWYAEDYYEHSPVANPCGAESGEYRCCRDVGYGCLMAAIRTISRGKCAPDYRFLHGGFRVVRSAE